MLRVFPTTRRSKESEQMLTQEEYVEIRSLRKLGWTYSAIARHLDVSRNTVKGYLRDGRQPGQRRRVAADPFERIEDYVRERLREDQHVWGSALYDEVGGLGYEQSYVTFARQVRLRGLRPHCDACAARGRHVATTEIGHEPGEEIQWDWVELEGAPWLVDKEKLHLLQGTLPHSGRTRGWIAESEDQAHLIEAIDQVLRRLGGTARRWRFDRMGTVVSPAGELLPSFAAVATYYGVGVDLCPSRRAKRKGAVEKTNHFSAQRWWRTAAVDTPEQAQATYDRFCETTGDHRERGDGTVADLAAKEQLRELPAEPYPALIELARTVDHTSLVRARSNRYSILPGLEASPVVVRWKLGSNDLEIVSPAGLILASHRRFPDGARQTVRLPEHEAALEKAVLEAFTVRTPCRRKENRPPGPVAKAIAATLRQNPDSSFSKIDLSRYEAFARAAR